jgi:ABC-type Fe3+/spermidine/putrescine transport system ATPase subunit
MDFDVVLTNITKTYGKTTAVKDFSLSVPKGSFTTLLGPSGCGKTTLLRIIAGFFEPDSGEVVICEQNQRGIPPEKRRTGIVFQDYALFPHMTALQNLTYALTLRKVEAATKTKEAAHIAEVLGLADLLARYPGELSGGQQQRLALGRVLILKPQILLMDEPLSNLDAKLRSAVRDELKDIQRRLGITTIYVTHDQEEALSLSDYIAVMNNGSLEQTGTPEEIYNRPQTAFAADFTGPANFIDIDGKHSLIRPEWLELVAIGTSVDAKGETSALTGTVKAVDFFGRTARVRVETASGIIAVDILPEHSGRFRVGSDVQVAIKRSWKLP